MSNFDYRNTDDPLRRNPPYDPDASAMNAAWGWIAAAVFLVVVLAVAFGIGHQPGTMNTASNDANPAATHMTPINPAPSTMAPAPGATTLSPTAPTASPTPAAPAPGGTAQ